MAGPAKCRESTNHANSIIGFPVASCRDTLHFTEFQQGQLNVEVNLTTEIDPTLLPGLRADILQALEDLKLDDQVRMG